MDNNSKAMRASSPDIYNLDNSRHQTGHVEEVEDDQERKSRFLEKRRDLVKDGGYSVSVDRRVSTSFQ